MPVPCQLVKPLCVVVGFERHTGLGVMEAPPFIGPNENCFWASLATTEWLLGDSSSDMVFHDGCGLIKRGSDVQFLRPHVAIGSLTPPMVTAPTDLGLIILWNALGNSKTVFGPFSVEARMDAGEADQNPAVIALPPWLPAGLANHTVCSEPISFPAACGQNPNSVYAGMTLLDYVGCLLLWAFEEAVSYALGEALGPMLDKAGKRVGNEAADLVHPWVADLVRPLVEEVVKQLGELLAGKALEGARGLAR
jgi:hypothetical protein